MNWIKIGVFVWGALSTLLAIILIADILFKWHLITAENSSVLAAIIAAGALTWSLFFQADVNRNDVFKELTSIKTSMARIETKFNDFASKSEYAQILKTLEKIEKKS